MILRTENGGKVWRLTSYDGRSGPAIRSVVSVTALDRRSCLAVGIDVGDDDSPWVSVTTDKGYAWTYLDLDTLGLGWKPRL